MCNAAGREEWDGLAHQQKENLMLVCRLSGYDEKFQRDCGLVTREQMEHWGIEEEVLFQDAWANMFAKRPPLLMDFEDAYGHHYDQNILSMEKNRRESGGRMPTFMSLPTTWIMGRCT